jgi:hypothetical protein
MLYSLSKSNHDQFSVYIVILKEVLEPSSKTSFLTWLS